MNKVAYFYKDNGEDLACAINWFAKSYEILQISYCNQSDGKSCLVLYKDEDT